MNNYLVIYQNKEGKCFHSIKTWPEIEVMLRKMAKVCGWMRVFRLIGTRDPQRMVINHCVDSYWLEDIYGNHVEGS